MYDLDLEKKIVSAQNLKEFKNSHKNKKFVFTNGCFDIIHAGHVVYLAKARQLGDFLIIGVNSDSSVRKIKGSDRPIISQHHRCIMLAAMEFVSFVVLFEEDTPEKLISFISPDIHVKGGDYKISELPEAKIVQSYGGRVKIMPLIPDISTTTIIDKLQR